MIHEIDYSSSSKVRTISQPTDVTAIILNEARKLIPEIWDGVTPLRQVGLGVAKLTHDVYLTLFEDENMAYYRQWDEDYDRRMVEMEKKDRHYRDGRDGALKFSYATGEQALKAAKRAVKQEAGRNMERISLQDGTDCFEIRNAEGKTIELHMVVDRLV